MTMGTKKKKYGPEEFRYAKPLADALKNDSAFGSWVLKQTKKFAKYADPAPRLLHVEMMNWRKERGSSAEYWWQFHHHLKCDCRGCVGGKETDLLAIFEAATGRRFALHIEVKHPTDRFDTKKKRDQAAVYPDRAQCWVTKTPDRVLPHEEATTALVFSELKREEFAPHLKHFDGKITFEDIKKEFPNWAPLPAKPT
jgi:hypothetical protein